MRGMLRFSIVFVSLASFAGPSYGRGERDANALAAMASLANGQTGIVCWQSRRTGALRIFACDLDGAGLRQVSPDAPGKDHLAPLISPDGTRILYFQTNIPLIGDNYYSDHVGDLMLVDADDTDGSSSRLLVSGVRTYFECRVARWLDDDRIAYIGSDHDGYVHSISQDSSSKLFDYPYDDFGAIPNRQLTFAIDGENRVFTINNPGPSGTLTEEQDFDGCEGNMSADGLYAYRVKGGWPGHDFTRMRLGSWEEEVFFECPSDSLPADQNYIYFPQLSLDLRFLSMGVSRDRSEHDHWESDYDIFVVSIDSQTFLETGTPVKYTFSTALDSYPDIWVNHAVLELPIRINCGSNDYDVSGWIRDDAFVNGGGDYVNPDTVATAGVANAAPAEVYKSVRNKSPHGYDIPLPDGRYLLRLHFADRYTDRSMNYFAEGVQILEDFDISSEAGGINRALVKDFQVTVADGNGLQLEAQSAEDVFEAGIEIMDWVDEEPQADGDGGNQDDGANDAGGDLADGANDGADDNLADAGNDARIDSDEKITVSGGCAGCSTSTAGNCGLLFVLLLGLLVKRD
ncbi:MAG TPA: malectin domain-containing carbohydrate-binding protein [Myxococcota bacterium]|nr:malectin domain-containing carbohydrate-binding protein [Myxococcota bacterium]